MEGEPQVKAVEIEAELRQIKSMTDHSYNIILNVGEEGLAQVKELMGWVLDRVKLVIIDEPK
jgi:hypothetical protein